MTFRVIVQGVPGEDHIQYFDGPIEVEAAYFRLCQLRTKGVGAVKIFSDPTGIIAPAEYRLDLDWPEGDGYAPRETYEERRSLWTETAEGYQVPTPFQLRGAAKALGLKEHSFDRVKIASRGLKYERLDQLTIDIITGTR